MAYTMQGAQMTVRYSALAAATIALVVLAGCASTSDGTKPKDENLLYEESTAKSTAPRCPAGMILQCEAKKTGRIRFGRIGNTNLENCACEPYQGMPTQSPVPGIQYAH